MLLNIVRAAVGVLPPSRFKNMILRWVGYEVASTASVGPILIWRVQKLALEAGSRMGPFNVLRDLSAVSLGVDAVIGQWNWISAAPSLSLQTNAGGSFAMGAQSAFTSRHYVDASGGVSIGDFTTVAGVRSTFVTHGIRWKDSKQVPRPIKIGDRCLIGSNCNVVPGAVVADRTVVGMGVTVAGNSAGGGVLILQPRGEAVGLVDGAYFTRPRGFVD